MHTFYEATIGWINHMLEKLYCGGGGGGGDENLDVHIKSNKLWAFHVIWKLEVWIVRLSPHVIEKVSSEMAKMHAMQ